MTNIKFNLIDIDAHVKTQRQILPKKYSSQNKYAERTLTCYELLAIKYLY